MRANCQECGDEFDFDESTGDGEFDSWECAEKFAEREQNTSDYDLAYGPRMRPADAPVKAVKKF
jgi:hypothetical protein